MKTYKVTVSQDFIIEAENIAQVYDLINKKIKIIGEVVGGRRSTKEHDYVSYRISESGDKKFKITSGSPIKKD